ncbi:IS4 family transposase, partial [Acinetobacter baumannii]
MLTMNVKAMLADFLTFVTPKSMHKARFSVLLDAVTALAKDACCTVTAIGRAMPGSSDKVSIKRADRLLMLPKDCKPVIVTDAGFKVPWLKQVRKLG